MVNAEALIACPPERTRLHILYETRKLGTGYLFPGFFSRGCPRPPSPFNADPLPPEPPKSLIAVDFLRSGGWLCYDPPRTATAFLVWHEKSPPGCVPSNHRPRVGELACPAPHSCLFGGHR